MDESTERWELPLKLRLDETNPELESLIAQSELQQKAWQKRANSPFGTQTPTEFERSRAVLRIASKLEVLTTLDAESEMYARVSIQLSEAYALVGRFDLAAQHDPRPNFKADYERIWQAVLRRESDWCEHRPNGPINVNVPTMRIRERNVWHIRQGREMPLIRCVVCGFCNVGPLPKDLEAQEAARAHHRDMLKGLSPQEAMARERQMREGR